MDRDILRGLLAALRKAGMSSASDVTSLARSFRFERQEEALEKLWVLVTHAYHFGKVGAVCQSKSRHELAREVVSLWVGRLGLYALSQVADCLRTAPKAYTGELEKVLLHAYAFGRARAQATATIVRVEELERKRRTA